MFVWPAQISDGYSDDNYLFAKTLIVIYLQLFAHNLENTFYNRKLEIVVSFYLPCWSQA